MKPLSRLKKKEEMPLPGEETLAEQMAKRQVYNADLGRKKVKEMKLRK